MQVRYAATKYIHIHQLCARFLAQRCRELCQHRTEGACFFPIQLGNMRYVSLRLQIAESEHFCVQAGRHPPVAILPDLQHTKLLVGFSATTKDTMLSALVALAHVEP